MLEMSCDQFMAATLTDRRYLVKRPAVKSSHYPARMSNRDRTEFGSRVIRARKHAQLTQHGLSAATGIKQSTIAEMEVSGQSSLMTPQIARACGVDAYWLATGEGQMLVKDEGAETSEAERIQSAMEALSKVLIGADEDTRATVGELLAAMATAPATVKNKSRLVLRLLVADRDKSHKSPQDRMREPHIFEDLGVLDLGDGNGRSNTDTATGGGRKK